MYVCICDIYTTDFIDINGGIKEGVCVESVLPVKDAGDDGHGVEGESQTQITDGQVDDEELGRLKQVLLLVGDIQKHAVPKH